MAVSVSQVVSIEPLFTTDITDPLGIWFGARELIGDASGGLASITLVIPPDFIFTVDFISALSSETIIARVFSMISSTGVTFSGLSESYSRNILGTVIAGGSQTVLINEGRLGPFRPDGGVNQPSVVLQTINTNLEVTRLFARGFLFDKSIFSKVSPAFWSRFISS